MDFEPHNFPALVASVIRSDPTLAEPLKEIFAAYARNDDLDECWSRIDGKFHHTLRLIMEDLNEIDDPISLDQEIQVLLHAIDEALLSVEQDGSIPAAKPRKKSSGKPKALEDDEDEIPTAKRKAAGKKTVKKKAAAKKTAVKKKTAGKKKVVKKKAAGKKAAVKKKGVVKKKAPGKKTVVKKAAAKKKAPVKKAPAGKKPKKKAPAVKKKKARKK